jgi:MFS family permease
MVVGFPPGATSGMNPRMKDHSKAKMPHGVGNAYAFQVFNTTSFFIAIGTPMVLCFKHWQVSTTVLGIVVAMPPLLNILQIPAADWVERTGYRKFMLTGWTLRTLLILGMAFVAILPEKIDRTTRIALMLFLLFLYNASRGISTCAFLPWITQWIPEGLRGRYLSGDQMSTALAVLGTTAVTAWFFRDVTGRVAFATMFGGSFVAGMVSLIFLRKIPDVPVPQSPTGRGRVPWKQIVFHPPFFRLLMYNIVFQVAMAGAGLFWVPMLRDRYAFEDWQFLGMMAIWGAAVAATLWMFRALADRVGSRPLLAVSGGVFVAHLIGWCSIAADVLPPTLWVIVLVQTTAGLGGALFNLANTRLAMGTVPPTGRSHFFAVFTVVNNLVLGVLPVAWGLLVDDLAGWQRRWSLWEWNQYSVGYAAVIAVLVASQIFRARLTEERAMSTDVFLNELLVKTPSRAISRLIARRLFS